MSEDRQKSGGGTGVVMLVVAILALLPILYVLSSGPVIWLTIHGYAPDVPLYAPLQWAGEHCEPFHKAFRWYLNFFV